MKPAALALLALLTLPGCSAPADAPEQPVQPIEIAGLSAPADSLCPHPTSCGAQAREIA